MNKGEICAPVEMEKPCRVIMAINGVGSLGARTPPPHNFMAFSCVVMVIRFNYVILILY